MNSSKEICEFIEKMNSSKRWDLEESAHNTDTVDNQKADGEPWKARKRHIGVLKKIFIEKMNSSKQCDLEESAHNTVDIDNTKADSEPRKARKRHIGVLKKM